MVSLPPARLSLTSHCLHKQSKDSASEHKDALCEGSCVYMRTALCFHTQCQHACTFTLARTRSHTSSLFLTHAGPSHDPPPAPRAEDFYWSNILTLCVKISSDLLSPLWNSFRLCVKSFLDWFVDHSQSVAYKHVAGEKNKTKQHNVEWNSFFSHTGWLTHFSGWLLVDTVFTVSQCSLMVGLGLKLKMSGKWRHTTGNPISVEQSWRSVSRAKSSEWLGIVFPIVVLNQNREVP